MRYVKDKFDVPNYGSFEKYSVLNFSFQAKPERHGRLPHAHGSNAPRNHASCPTVLAEASSKEGGGVAILPFSSLSTLFELFVGSIQPDWSR